MFGKRSDTASSTTIIGRGARFNGTLELEGDVHIEGQCEGTIRAHARLSIGPRGSVVGELTGSSVVIAGRVEGTAIATETLHVLSSGSLQGDVFYGRLQVDAGGIIDGTTHQGQPSSSVATGGATETAREVDEESRDESLVIDARPKGASGLPSAASGARSNAPARR